MAKVKRLILDRGYDSDPLRFRLQEQGIDMICPHRRNRKKPKTYDARKLRRYKRRWKVERTFAWFGNYRRLLVRWEHDLTVYRGFFHLACALITLNSFETTFSQMEAYKAFQGKLAMLRAA